MAVILWLLNAISFLLEKWVRLSLCMLWSEMSKDDIRSKQTLSGRESGEHDTIAKKNPTQQPAKDNKRNVWRNRTRRVCHKKGEDDARDKQQEKKKTTMSFLVVPYKIDLAELLFVDDAKRSLRRLWVFSNSVFSDVMICVMLVPDKVQFNMCFVIWLRSSRAWTV